MRALLPALFLATTVAAQYDCSRCSPSGDKPSVRAAISADGGLVVFDSASGKLTQGDTNGKYDVFLWRATTQVVERVSQGTSGAEGNGHSWRAAISGDGRYVAFQSNATNLAAADTNGYYDIFVRDLQTGVTERVSLRSDGAQGNGNSYAPAISANGRYVAFQSDASNFADGDANAATDVFVYDRLTHSVDLVSQSTEYEIGSAGSYRPSISAGGQFVAFVSDATNLAAGDSNHVSDAFVRDRVWGTTTCVSVNPSGLPANGATSSAAISPDGFHVAFHSLAADLVEGDTNAKSDVFLRNMETWATTRVSVSWFGSQANGSSAWPAVSQDGHTVVFETDATNLEDGDANGLADVYAHDTLSGATEAITAIRPGATANRASGAATISSDGRFVAFESDATDLTDGDANSLRDVFRTDTRPVQIGVTIAYDGLAGAPPTKVDLTFRHYASTRVWGGVSAMPLEGALTLRLPRAPVNLTVKQSHWLRQTQLTYRTDVDFYLSNGDADLSNAVDTNDMTLVLIEYGLPSPSPGDLDESGAVDINDLILTMTNYGLVGDE